MDINSGSSPNGGSAPIVTSPLTSRRERLSSLPDLAIATPLTTTRSPDTQSITGEEWNNIANESMFVNNSHFHRDRSLMNDYNSNFDYFTNPNQSIFDINQPKSPIKQDWNAKIESEIEYYANQQKREMMYNDDVELNSDLMQSPLLPSLNNFDEFVAESTDTDIKTQEETLSYSTADQSNYQDQAEDSYSMNETHSLSDSVEAVHQPERKPSRDSRRNSTRSKVRTNLQHLTKNERNNIAALKYRAKKKQEEIDLRHSNQRMAALIEEKESEIDHLSKENQILKEQVAYLSSKVNMINNNMRNSRRSSNDTNNTNNSTLNSHQSPSVASAVMTMLSAYLFVNPSVIESKLGIKLTSDQLMELQKSAYQPLTKVYGSIAVNQALHQISTSLIQIQTPRPIVV